MLKMLNINVIAPWYHIYYIYQLNKDKYQVSLKVLEYTVYKRGCKLDMVNYRLFSVLGVMAKIIEKLSMTRLKIILVIIIFCMSYSQVLDLCIPLRLVYYI